MEARTRARTRPPSAAPALMFTNSGQEPTCPERHQNKGLVFKVTNDETGFIAFRGIICMNFTSLVNNPLTVINKTACSVPQINVSRLYQNYNCCFTFFEII